MSLLSGSTKKVSVYGRKAEVRVVNRHSAFTTLENDEKDPFGFFQPQTKPKTTYGKSRASVLPTTLQSSNADLDGSAVYDTADSSLSFHSACSSTSGATSTKPQPLKNNSEARPRKPLISKAVSEQMRAVTKGKAVPRASKAGSSLLAESDAIDATPKARRSPTKRGKNITPKTVRKAPSSSTATSILPNESTPPPLQPTGRAPRRAAQAARSAIEDYDFTDRDMTPRRPVPTKSYFFEKARQLAELALEESEGKKSQQPKVNSSKASGARPRKTIATAAPGGRSRKSMAPKPRQTSALGYSLSSAIAVSDSSMSSANGVSDCSFDGAGTSQSSFSLTGQSSDESHDRAPKNKVKQNKRATRRIAANSDDEEEGHGASEDESEQDPALQLAARVADLAVQDEEGVTVNDDHLTGLLAAVSQATPEAFSGAIQRLRSSSASVTSTRRVEKIGEASYSEVFKISTSSRSAATIKDEQEAVVLKIIPISVLTSTGISNNDNTDLPYTSPAADVEREIRLMQLITRESTVSTSFVSLRSAHVVRGTYPAALLQAWDRWDVRRRAKTGEGAENVRPHVLGRQQVYALLVMTDGGTDLESLRVKSWSQAASIFQQVADGLGKMESKYEFEHRDLHWGNILVQAVPQGPSLLRADSDATSWLSDPAVTGVKATIIDFTLSRAQLSPLTRSKKNVEVLHYPFDDGTLFEGSGDPQYDVYREMRTVTRDSWQAYCPATNVLWLRYLAHKLIDVKCKSLKTPKRDTDAEHEVDAFEVLKKAAMALDEAAQQLLDEATQASRAKKAPVSGRNSMHPRARKSVLPTSATAGARKGRSTMALGEVGGEEKVVRSAAELVSFLSQ